MKQLKKLSTLLLCLALVLSVLPTALAADSPAGDLAPKIYAEDGSFDSASGSAQDDKTGTAPAVAADLSGHTPDEPASVIASGSCGDNLTWTFTDDGVLSITGTGAMYDYGTGIDVRAPWYDNHDAITSVSIGDGVTSIGSYAFYDCAAVTDFSVAGGNPWFRSVDGVLYNYACTVLYAYPGGRETLFFTAPASVRTIEANAFSDTVNLLGVTLPAVTELRKSALHNCSVYNVCCPKLQTIGDGAFAGCHNLAEFTFGPQVESIGGAAFVGCTGIEKLTFMGSAPTVGRRAFPTTLFADAYYPADDDTWTEEVRQSCGAPLNWVGYAGLPDGYYLIGPAGWTDEAVDLSNCFVLNYAQGNDDSSVDEYMLTATLTAGDPIKVVKVFNGTINGWYPNGTGNEYTVDAAHSGSVTIYFRSRYNSAWSDFGGYIWIEPNVTEYGLRVDGTEVTSANMSDILGNGIFSFDGESTLTVSGDYSSPASNDQLLPVIENYGLDGLTVDLQGQLTGYLTLDRNTTICGTGSLVLPADRGAIYGIRCRSLTVIDVTLDIHTSGTALWGWYNDSALVLENVTATLESGSANGRPTPAVNAFSGGITLRKCSVVEPTGAKVDEDGSGMICDEDGELVNLVKIGRWENPFVDVKEGKYYYDPVLWAYYHDPQVTNGTDDTHFSPNKTCTRAQVVTFLWRAVGCPEPTVTTHSFVDVKSSAYYYKAMLWAVENNITTGTSATTFGPNKEATRAQVVTFIWRTLGSPEPETTDCPFTDLKPTASYYKAVLWAVENGITNGTTATTFSPNKTCTRGQVVTFLYNAFAE